MQGHSVRVVYVLRLLRLVRVVRLVNGLQPGSSGGASGPLKVRSFSWGGELLMWIDAVNVNVGWRPCTPLDACMCRLSRTLQPAVPFHAVSRGSSARLHSTAAQRLCIG